MLLRIRNLLKLFRRDLLVIFIALKHRGTPLRVKLGMAALLVYLASPIDFLPDAIPFMGLVDDLAITPAAIYGLMQMLPPAVRRSCEEQAEHIGRRMPYILVGASLLILLWVILVLFAIYSLITWIIF